MNRRPGRVLTPCRFCGAPRTRRTSVTRRRIPACPACAQDPTTHQKARAIINRPRRNPEAPA